MPYVYKAKAEFLEVYLFPLHIKSGVRYIPDSKGPSTWRLGDLTPLVLLHGDGGSKDRADDLFKVECFSVVLFSHVMLIIGMLNFD